MHWGVERLKRPATIAVVTWLVGLAAFTVLSVESLLAEPHAVFAFARLTAYIASMTVAALTVALVALFALGCGAMLWWLDDAVDRRWIAAAVGRAFWVLVAYTWIGLVLLLADPPVAMTLAEMSEPDFVEAEMEGTLAYQWLKRLRVAVIALFVGTMVWMLARRAKLLNAVLAVAFGAGMVAALVTALGTLGGEEDF